jgi:hypothetical protein
MRWLARRRGADVDADAVLNARGDFLAAVAAEATA